MWTELLILIKIMKFLIIIVLILSCIHDIGCDDLDCTLDYQSSYSECYVSGTYGFYIYCGTPYKCCENGNGCCYNGDKSVLYTEAELVGLVLNATALFVVGLLGLVICGATYCNDKEDVSHLFFKNGSKK